MPSHLPALRPAASGRGWRLSGGALSRVLAVVALTLLAAACARIDSDQARVCESIVPAVEISAPFVRLISTRPLAPSGGARVRVDYAVPDASGHDRKSFLICRFGGADFSLDRLRVTGLAGPDGPWSEVELLLLNRFWLGELGAVAEGRARLIAPPFAAIQLGPDVPAGLGYFLQQWVNATPPSAVYAALALAYALIYGITGRINLAFGPMAMLGAYGAVAGIGLSLLAGAAGIPVPLSLALFLSLAVAALLTASSGWVIARTVFLPLASRANQSLLIATIGLAIALEEIMRLTQGAHERWLQPVLNDPVKLLGGPFPVVATPMQGVVAVLSLVAVLAVLATMRRTALGRAWKAVADDSRMARLCGVDPVRIVGLSFIIAGALTAIAGFVYAVHYGGTSFTMGLFIGLKALVAAIVGHKSVNRTAGKVPAGPPASIP